MKDFLIDLHNHLISSEGRLKKKEKIVKYILNRCECNVRKIFAFTDHFEKIKKNYFGDGLKKYKSLYDNISKNDGRYECLIGLEIDVRFNDFDTRHIIVIFEDFQIFLKKIKDFLDGDENRETCFIFKEDDENKEWKKLLCDSIVIPHFAKSSNGQGEHKNRNFQNDEILCWNRIKDLPKIKFLEVSNLFNFIFKSQDDIIKDNNFDLIFASDNCDDLDKLSYPPLASYICVNDKECENGAFNTLKNFINGINKSTQSLLKKSKINFPNTKINLSFFSNSLIYGSRGSGKSELCKRLKFYFGSDENVFFLKQGKYIINSKDEIKQKLEENSFCQEEIKSMNNKMKKIEEIFLGTLRKIDPNLVQSKEKINEEINKKNSEIIENIVKNLNDENHTFERTKNKYKKIEGYVESSENSGKFENIEKITNNFIAFLESFFGGEYEIKSNEQKKCFLVWLKEISKYLILEYKECLRRKKIEIFINEIFSQLKNEVSNITKWNYRFNFSLLKYWLLKQIITTHEKIIHEVIPQRKIEIVKYDEKYGLKFEINLDKNKYFKVEEIGLDKMKLITFIDKKNYFLASFGQTSEFLIKNSIKSNKKCSVFILDEPEYGLDNNFIKNDLSPFLNKIWDIKNKYLFLVTHNHVMWSELFEKREGGKTYIHCYYDGGHKVEQSTKFKGNTFLDNYEAGSDSYKYRNNLYNKEDLEK